MNQPAPAAVWLVDASIYVFRAWFERCPPRYDRQHHPVNAVHGFLRFVYQLLSTEKPTHIAFAFDTSLQESERKNLYPAYKANREPAPEALKYQFQLCRDFISALGLVQASSTRYEADDLIGSWASQQHQSGQRLMIISGDKDLTQLVREHDLWWDYGRRRPYNAGTIKSELGVWPQQVADQLALAGDRSDNIPGVPGVGMSTAAKLLKHFGTLENLLADTDAIATMQIRGAVLIRDRIRQYRDTILLARQLTGIRDHLDDLPCNLARGSKNPARLEHLCRQLNLELSQYRNWMQV
ncbi:MAG: flap endonuclease [Thiothrix sp.]|nr:flap endonuclease [Thiothrix sp.]HPQ95426.1 5'-3' exonuclease H3TH domain-containing protein [Thiolinea sp.]